MLGRDMWHLHRCTWNRRRFMRQEWLLDRVQGQLLGRGRAGQDRDREVQDRAMVRAVRDQEGRGGLVVRIRVDRVDRV